MVEGFEATTAKPPKFQPENPFLPGFNDLPSTVTKPQDTPAAGKDNTNNPPATPDTNNPTNTPPEAGPRPGNLPSVRLSEGIDIFLPDVNWKDFLDKANLPEGTKPGEKPKDGQPPTSTPSDTKPQVPATPGDGKPTDGKPAQPPAEVALPKNVFVNNDTKMIGRIEYDKKVREFKHDARGLSEVNQTDATGTKTYLRKDDGKWYFKYGTQEVAIAGEFQLRGNGDFAVRNSPKEPWQIETPDGKIKVEQPGQGPGDAAPKRPQAELAKDDHGNIKTVTLPNGSTRSYTFDESGKNLLQITDRLKTTNGERVEQWTRQANPTGGFTENFSRTQPPGSNEVRTNIKQVDNGAYQYTDGRGEVKTSQLAIQGDAQPKTPWKADCKLDDVGRFKSIENDRFKRDYEYFEGTTKIKSYHVQDKTNGQSCTWSRSEPTSADWTGQTGDGRTAKMQGEFAVTDDGVHVIQKISGRLAGGKSDGAENYAYLGNGGRVDIAATADNGITAGEGGSARYVRRGDGSTVAYVGADNNQISVFDAQTRTRTNWTKGADSLWRSDSPYEPDARKDMGFSDRGELSYVDEQGSTRMRTLEGEELVSKKDGSKLVYDVNGKLSKVKFGNITRTFQKDSQGNVTNVLDSYENGESMSIFPPPLKNGEKIENAKMSETGDLTYTVKGADDKIARKVTERSNGSNLEHDADDKLIKAKKNGVTRRFEYVGEGKDKQLLSITDTRATKDGDRSTVWARKAGAEGKLSDDFHCTENGKERTARKIGNIMPDGEYEYSPIDAKAGDKPRIQSLAGGDGGFTGSVEESRINLLDSMEKNMDEPRAKRMNEMMKAYEERMLALAQARKLAKVVSPEQIDQETSDAVSRTYDHLSQMVNSDDTNTFFDKNQRVFLAENFMYHAQDPSTMDQGPASDNDSVGHGTCWINSANIWGLTKKTDHMADLLKQVSLTGSYTTKNSGKAGDQPKTVTFSKQYLNFPADKQETAWCISKATDMWDRQPNLIRQCDGDRSPVGKIFDYTLPVIGNRPQNARALDGGTHESFTTTGNRWYVGNAEIMKMVTGEQPVDQAGSGHGKNDLIDGDFRKSILEKGTVLNYEPGHAKSMHLRQIGKEWVLIQDNQHGEMDDRIIARISDIEKWAAGDRSVERQVNEYVNQRKFKLETDATIVGKYTPTPDTNEYSPRNNQPNNNHQYNNYDPYNQPQQFNRRRYRGN